MYLHHLHSVPVVNIMVHMTIQVRLTNPHLSITSDEKYYAHPMEMDIIKYLVSKGHFCSLSGDIHTVKDSNDCALALYSKKEKTSNTTTQFPSLINQQIQ